METNSKFQDFIKNKDVDIIRREFSNYNTMLLMYRCGIKEVQTKLEILNEEFKAKARRNPIEHIKSRVKSVDLSLIHIWMLSRRCSLLQLMHLCRMI